ncbi:helix-turn-helix domain-containing protein [Bifidobacterium callitrichidarum]|nr:helix-turn-helix transcriptional regulator [Bifidobacterium callitrichidarum]
MEMDFTEAGFDELDAGTALVGEEVELIRKLSACRKHNAEATGKPEQYTIEAVAKRMAVTPGEVQDIEEGVTDIADTLFDYARAVGLNVHIVVRSAVDGAVID